MMPETIEYLAVGAVLFALGAIGFLTRRNVIIMMLSAEMMLHGVIVNLASFSHWHGNYQGQVFALFIVTVAACEAALALALFVALFQRRHSLDSATWSDLGEDGQRPALPEEAAGPGEPPPSPYPRLTPAGRVPEAPKQEATPRV